MKLLLVSPLCPPSQGQLPSHGRALASEADEQLEAWSSQSMRNRHTYTEQDLKHEWRLLAEHAEAADGVTAQSVFIVTVHRQAVLTLFADIPVSGTPSALELEEAANRVASEVLDRLVGQGWTMRWVNRTLLAASDHDLPRGWLAPDTTELLIDCGPTADCTKGSRLGWGNNVIVGFDALDAVDQREIRRGLVDAQVVWTDLEGISTASAALARHQASGDVTSRKHLDRATRVSEELMATISGHNLLFDDLTMNLQGCRRTVAESLLDIWGYERLRSRIHERVRDIEMIAVRQRQRVDLAYQRAVEGVLLFLGIVSGAQLMLGLVSLAFTGKVDVEPGGDSPGLMHLLRAVDTDLWVTIMFAVVLVVCVYLWVIKRRAR